MPYFEANDAFLGSPGLDGAHHHHGNSGCSRSPLISIGAGVSVIDPDYSEEAAGCGVFQLEDPALHRMGSGADPREFTERGDVIVDDCAEYPSLAPSTSPALSAASASASAEQAEVGSGGVGGSAWGSGIPSPVRRGTRHKPGDAAAGRK